MRVPPYQDLRIFRKGISTVSQWTGNEFRQMEKVLIGLLDGMHTDARVIVTARAILDFIYLAHYPSHSTSTLTQMRAALEDFHRVKQVFVDLGIRSHFNIPKLHWMVHYIKSIIDLGTCDGLSTEISERLHIDFAKLAYRASNRKAYIKQMITWLTRREKVRWFQAYLRWLGMRGVIVTHPEDSAEDYYDDEIVADATTPEEAVVEHAGGMRHSDTDTTPSSYISDSGGPMDLDDPAQLSFTTYTSSNVADIEPPISSKTSDSAATTDDDDDDDASDLIEQVSFHFRAFTL